MPAAMPGVILTAVFTLTKLCHATQRWRRLCDSPVCDYARWFGGRSGEGASCLAEMVCQAQTAELYACDRLIPMVTWFGKCPFWTISGWAKNQILIFNRPSLRRSCVWETLPADALLARHFGLWQGTDRRPFL